MSSGKHFHNVLCLSEAKGMDIIMKRKHLRRALAGACAVVVATSGMAFPQANAQKKETNNSELKLWYNSPAADSYDGWEKWSLPIGNSGIGANVFGGETKRAYSDE